MPTPKFQGMVRVWQDGEQWRWVPVSEWAPEHAVVAKRFKADGEEVIHVEREGTEEIIREAVRAM